MSDLHELHRLHQERVAIVVAQNLADAGNARAIKLVKPDKDGCTILYVHPSSRKRGFWQLSWCDWNGEPSGHADHFKSRDDALRSASGDWLVEPPYGGTDYKVEETA